MWARSIPGRCYEHRRDWLEQKLLDTASVFAIKLCAYTVMSNHYHVVLHVRPDLAASWTDNEVIKRWHQLFSGTLLSHQYLLGKPLNRAEQRQIKAQIKEWRHRLTDISWFMRIVNEAIARQANAEDDCTGRFWEGRFKSQALLDEAALLTCMAYVDLNPIRAGIAPTPEASEFTSIKCRIEALKAMHPPHQSLEDFVGNSNNIGIAFRIKDYLELVDWTARIVRDDKRGFISNSTASIFERLNLPDKSWIF